MRADKLKAVKLRLSGKSYTEISRLLNIPKSTLSGWLSNLALPKKAKKRIAKIVKQSIIDSIVKRNKNQTILAIERMNQIRSAGKLEINNNLSKEQIKYIGISLYWAEGYKRAKELNGRILTNHPVALTNSDPKLIQIFLRFLREVCEVKNEHIKADIRMFDHMNSKQILKFWKRITQIPEKNFGKIYYGISKSSLGKRPFNRLPYGTILVRVNNTNLFHKIMGWIEALSEQG
ncbi:helix-turn-helix domain-containing protein [Candidatus Giovannonibacteria bacterium]|nr:helix-turn-helix domain-containing protein [Candidatus Giovannonibacteria bacterium]